MDGGREGSRVVERDVQKAHDIYMLYLWNKCQYRWNYFRSSSKHSGHVMWGPFPHSMARPRVADGGTASTYGC
jgi:hypothetical protein